MSIKRFAAVDIGEQVKALEWLALALRKGVQS